jgi:hypothetical protein
VAVSINILTTGYGKPKPSHAAVQVGADNFLAEFQTISTSPVYVNHTRIFKRRGDGKI